MSDNLEIVMDIETLEIFEVIDLEKEKEVITKALEESPKERKVSPYDELDRIWLGNGYYYKPSSLLWEVVEDDTIHQLMPRNKHGTYPYYKHARDGSWGRVLQLTPEETLWKTLELNPELMSYV
ncbi:hypothetical protein BKX95_11930 [Streptococcus iniae]|nr:hypothetical protein BKX95_11930 [Streptococcus iniae]